MIHITFQLFNGLVVVAITVVYQLLLRHHWKVRREQKAEIEALHRAVDCAEERLKFMSNEFQRSSVECSKAKEEVGRLRRQLMVKMGAGQN